MNLTFVGGIHGAGKSTFCRELAPLANARHVTAGELIRLASGGGVTTGKAVRDVDQNQKLLLGAVGHVRPAIPAMLLDGHFTLIRSDSEVEPIPLEVFQVLCPSALLLLAVDPMVARQRLLERDGKDYDLGLLREHDRAERIHARAVSDALGVPLGVFTGSTAVNEAKQFLTTNIHSRG
jgi:adenylate kinase